MVLSREDSGNSRLQEKNPPLSLFVGPLVIFRNLKENTNLLWNFIQRDIRLKYRNSMMGYFWSLLEPLILSGVYYVLFMVIAGKADPRYPLWVIIGVITWTFFSKSMNGGIISLTRNGELIKQVYLPREIFAITNVGSNLIIACLSLLIVIPFMIYLEIEPTAQLYMVPLGLILVSCLGLGIGLLFSCLNTINRDIEHVFRIVTRAGLFLSPVMWTIEMLPQSRQTILNYLMLNPMVVPITMIRNGIDGSPLGVELNYIVYSVVFCVSSLLLGAMIFKRYEAETVKYL
tara:strand:- start:413 stop:1276 length:864 start_codon:yes stop_codon:yes gene_type:complete